MIWIAMIVTPFLLALLLPLLRQMGRAVMIAAPVGALVVAFVTTLTQLGNVESAALTYDWTWVPQFDLSLSLYIDGLSLLFVLLVTGIGAGIFLYAGFYFDDPDEVQRFYLPLMLFTGAMLWLVMAGNVLTLFIAWELTSITSFMLISFKGAKYESARKGALQALMVTGAGGLALIVGLLLVGTAAGSMELTTILNTSLADHPWYAGMVVLLGLAAFTKSAQMPFHFWLPGAMDAPSPASAFLHSATMVKAGIYLLARFYPTLGDTLLWTNLLVGVGLTTFLVASLMALTQRDLKGLLAYTTIAALGSLVALIGLPAAAGLKALMVGILAHALYKAPLFLLAGVIDHATGTRIVDKLGGLRKTLPITAIVTTLAAVSMAGVIPMMGFVGKETFLEAFIDQPLALAAIVAGAVLTVVVALILIWDVFMGEQPPELHPHKPGWGLLAAPAVIASMGLIGGLALPQIIIPVIDPAIEKDFALYLFPGFNLAFMLSTAAIIGGVLLFLVRGAWLPTLIGLRLPSAKEGYEGTVAIVEWCADQLLKTQNGKLRYYLVVILGAVGAIMVASGIVPDALRGAALDLSLSRASEALEVVLLGLAIFATLFSVLFRNHLYAALSLGVMGYAVAGIFLLEPAPDVALVQFLAETLGTVLVIIMIGRIERERRDEAIDALWDISRGGIWRDAIVATVVGVGVGLFALTAVLNRPDRGSISQWHLENAYIETGVVDVVASIIADFRGTDTLIEIFVFGMAALGVLTLLTVPQAKELLDSDTDDHEHEDNTSPLSTPLARGVATLVLPLALMISFMHILYAGDSPGDGFTAGVISGLAVALWYMVYGYDEARRRLSWLRPGRLIGIGLGVALLNALLPLFDGRNFFAITKITGFDAPAGLHLASTLIFEIGIFLTVFGAASIVMEAIAHPKEVEF